MAFRKDIEGLRAVAILLVVASHATLPGFSGGFVGVDVFFVVSGYLITGLILAEVARTGTFGYVAFYARRARRLLPALLLLVLVVLVAGIAVYSGPELKQLGKWSAAVSVYVVNIEYALEWNSGLPLDATTGNPLRHLWSLSVEEHFYALWPLALIGLGGLGLRRGRRRKTLLAGLVAATFASLALSVIVGAGQPNDPWFVLTPNRIWEFSVGGLVAMAGVIRFGRATAVALSIAGIALIAVATSTFDFRTTPFPGIAAVVPVAGTACLLLVGAGGTPAYLRWLEARPMQWLGARSYSWYLWHWPFIAFASALIADFSRTDAIIAAGLSLIPATAAYSLVENPIRYSTVLRARQRLSLGLGAVASGAVFAAGAVVWWLAGS